MSFIRERQEERTGYQEIAPLNPAIDVGTDFVMVYGNDDTVADRIREYKRHGYVVHLMTGSAWGDYADYLYGKWDGRDHWAEAQTKADGTIVGHGKDTPYMVPTVAFADYLSERLRVAIDAGVEAIHLEEPEFWDYSGYSEAFKQQFELYYRTPWRDPASDVDTHYKAAQLKAYLYKRLLTRIGDSIKDYSIQKGKVVRFYVPTHSLVNYTQWKIMSPEGMLNDINSLDGFIAQVWTGTSRTPNTYRGLTRERTLETAYCEYSVMQELIRGTGKRMWFLADPIEDNPRYEWSSYQASYLETVTASLLHPGVSHYEVCPWLNRVFNGHYPVSDRKNVDKESKPIPGTYKTLLNNMFQTLGNMDQPDAHYEHNGDLHLGVALSDTALYQRSYPEAATSGLGQLSQDQMAAYASDAFPMFYGMSLPLIKRGLPLRVVQIDNVLKAVNYLKDLKYLVLSYDFMKPSSPAVNVEIANWVRGGGTLIYIGDNRDPYNKVAAWWNDNGRTTATPLDHLLASLGLDRLPTSRVAVGSGHVVGLAHNPALITTDTAAEARYVATIDHAVRASGDLFEHLNDLTLLRGPYVVTAVLNETSNLGKTRVGHFVDLQTPNFEYRTSVTTAPGHTALLYDVDRVKDQSVAIIGSTARILSANQNQRSLTFALLTNQGTNSYLMLRVSGDVSSVKAQSDSGKPLDVQYTLFPESQLVKINYEGTGERVILTLQRMEEK
ncbi:hypothetical protein [Lacticaseibacillus kribbianus]|uniref:hypothetical protein n=1 Tax=Lacticaseibacillus kribbianus TaxID=2926292 RepID=UPI001CD80CD5|nr:hypothetical protein [Lacticaseibacillus kribbianus]